MNMMQRGLTEEQLAAKAALDLKNKRTGLAIFQASWIMVFVCLILVNLQLRSNAVSWPPPGTPPLEPIIPTVVTLALVGSSLFIRQATRAVKAGQTAAFVSGWQVAMVLGAAFIAAMAFEWLNAPSSGQYRDVFRMMVGFHGVHALVIGGFLVKIYQNRAHYGAEHFWPVEGAAGLWHFVVIAWVLFYVVLYLI